MSSLATFTIAEYERMIACGAFSGPGFKRLELIGGELRMMSPQGAQHGEVVAALNDWSHDVTDRRQIRVRIQTSVEFPHLVSQPEPDVVWAVAKSYAQRRPQPDEILLVIEVADSSLCFDLGEKCALYATAGIRDYWVVDIPGRSLHVLRDPTTSGYLTHLCLGPGEEATPLCSPNGVLKVAALFRCLDD